jgi:hypothetical protein
MSLGENASTWGQPKLNTVIDLIDEAVGGVESISTTGGTTTLTSTNYTSDQARNACLVFTGTLASNAIIVVPNVEKLYLAVNNTTGSYSLTVKTAAGTGYALRSGPNWVYCDATNVSGAVPRLDQAPLATASVDLNSQRVTNLGTPSASTDAATKAYVDAAVSTTPTQNLATSAGTALAPTYSWATDSNTGLYLVGSDSVGLSAGGTVRATVSSTGLAVNGVFSASGAMTASGGLGVTGAVTTSGGVSVGTTLGVTGAATFGSTCAVTGAATLSSTLSAGATTVTTLAASGAATLSSTLAVTGAVTASSTVTTAGVILGPAGSVSAPSHSFSTDTNSGVYSGGADIVAIATGGVARLTANATGDLVAAGDVYIGQSSTSTPGYGGNTTVGGVVRADGRIFSNAAVGGFSSLGLNADGAVLLFERSGANVGFISVTTTATSYSTSSDYRLKTDIEPLTGAVDRLKALKPARFRFKSEAANAKKVDGFIAHEVAKVCPEAVIGEKDGVEMQGLDKSRLMPLTIAAVQELKSMIDELRSEIKALKKNGVG